YSHLPTDRRSTRSISDRSLLPSSRPHSLEAFGRLSRFHARPAGIEITPKSAWVHAQTQRFGFRKEYCVENPTGHRSQADRLSSRSAALADPAVAWRHQRTLGPTVSLGARAPSWVPHQCLPTHR